MKKDVTVEATRVAESEKPFCREAILRVLDKAPDGYKLLARLVEDPCELVQYYDPNAEEKADSVAGDLGCIEIRVGKPEDLLRKWLITNLTQENW